MAFCEIFAAQAGEFVRNSYIGVSLTVRNHIIRHVQESEHTARFFDSDESRAKLVAEFLAEGYSRDEVLIVIARPRVWTEVQGELISLAFPFDRATAEKRLIVRDALETLNRISVRGVPSAPLFDSVIGSLVRTASRGRPVRAYGAMVDILAQQSEFDLAVRIEQLWSGLARQVPLNLMCGYSAAHFVSPGAQDSLSAICAAHDRVDMHPQDQLSNWLLGNAGVRPAVG